MSNQLAVNFCDLVIQYNSTLKISLHFSWFFMKLRGSTFYFCSDGGYFNAIMTFPQNYPNSPPSVRFTSEMWHPNGKLRNLTDIHV